MLEVYTDMQVSHMINRTARPRRSGGSSVGHLSWSRVGSRLAAIHEFGSRRCAACTAYLARCCGHCVCRGAQIVCLGPNAAWLSAGGSEVRRKNSGGEPQVVCLLKQLAYLPRHASPLTFS